MAPWMAIPSSGTAISGRLPILSLNDERMMPDVQAGMKVTISKSKLHL